MLHEHHPPYPHFAHLPYAHEPLKTIYVGQRLFTTLLLVPCWFLYYALLPRRYRPRPSWSVRQIINVNFTRRIYKVTEVAGVTWGTRNPEEEPPQRSLKETTFQWVPPLADELRSGVLVSDRVPFKRVGTFVWSRSAPGHATPSDLATDSASPLIGIFMHGGGYCHMSAHENSRTSRIPRRLIRDKQFAEIYSVEYRLLQDAPFPAVLQDAAAVYAEIVRRYGTIDDSRPGSGCRIVPIGDSSGGNLALALTRWVRDEAKLPAPHGLLLLSPSCDVSHVFPTTPSSYVPRPHGSTDYLVDTPEPRALLQRTFLGFKNPHIPLAARPPDEQEDTQLQLEEKALMEVVHSEYISPASPKVLRGYGHPVAANTHPNSYHKPSDVEAYPTFDAVGPLQILNTPPGSQSENCVVGLFTSFPPTLIVVGDAERLEREVKNLIGGMENDGVEVDTVWAKDAVHDILILADGWWDEKVREGVWKRINGWVGQL